MPVRYERKYIWVCKNYYNNDNDNNNDDDDDDNDNDNDDHGEDHNFTNLSINYI